MPADDLHPGVDPTTKQFTSGSVRAGIVAMAEMVAALTAAKSRSNHTGTQLHSTISDWDTEVPLAVPVASDTVQGKIERATTTEVQTMTDTARAVTPAGLAAAAVSAATANRIIRRDANGRAAVATPSATGDIATKGYVDSTTNGRGTTAQRDAFYGATTTVAQQVALANQIPLWFNTTTRMWETYYAVAGSAGLTVPGLFSGWKAAGWYAAPAMAPDWAGKTGPTSASAAFKNVWTRGMHSSASVMDAVADTGGIRIALDGLYEIVAMQRGNSANNYMATAINGNREALENRNNATGTPPNSGIWSHSHPGGVNTYGFSNYLGQLLAGDLITAGPQVVSGTDLVFGATSTPAYFTIKRLG